MRLCRDWLISPPALSTLYRPVEIGGQTVYFAVESGVYNWVPDKKRVPVVHPVLDAVKAQHADNFGWALACCARHRDIAEDVLQEAYLRVLDGRAEFGGRSSHKTWFFAVIKRVAVDLQRSQERRTMLNLRVVASDQALAAESGTGRSNPPADSMSRDESVQQLQDALMQLSARQREVLHLVFYAELTLEATAEVLRISVGSSRTHYHRGKERLAELLKLDTNHDT
jgi:RNA polymerase sigma factor (sigma-70 family)